MESKNLKKKTENKIKSVPGYIITHPKYIRKNDNLQLLRITVTEFETKFDFGYQATSFYENGGWIKINPKTFIRPTGTNKKFFLTNATNIPYGPEKLHFNSSIEWRYFSLHFPSIMEDSLKNQTLNNLSKNSTKIDSLDLIEKENGTENDFNFFEIKIEDDPKKSFLI